MLVAGDIFQEGQERIGAGFAQLLLSHIVAHGVMRTVEAVLAEHAVAGALVGLLVLSVLEDKAYHLVVGVLVGFGIA